MCDLTRKLKHLMKRLNVVRFKQLMVMRCRGIKRKSINVTLNINMKQNLQFILVQNQNVKILI